MTNERCRSCNAEIIWVRAKATGRLCPLDAVPVPNGLVMLNEQREAVFSKGGLFDQLPEGTVRYTSHFATCPHAKEHRRTKS